jgi:hypothetical protein
MDIRTGKASSLIRDRQYHISISEMISSQLHNEGNIRTWWSGHEDICNEDTTRLLHPSRNITSTVQYCTQKQRNQCAFA